jgi:hypothetical protein
LAIALIMAGGLYFVFRPTAGQTTGQPSAPTTPPSPHAVPPPQRENDEERLSRYKDVPTRDLIRAPGSFEFEVLMARGAAAFDEYERVLNDPDADTFQVERVLGVLEAVKGDRSRFRDATLARLGDKRQDIRRTAVQLLAHIGREEDTSPVVVMLLDNDAGIRKAAADTLTAIGGVRIRAALDIILADPFRYLDRDEKPILSQAEVDHLTRCRAKVEHRIRVAERKAKAADKK